MARTDWTASDTVKPKDMNEIGTELAEIANNPIHYATLLNEFTPTYGLERNIPIIRRVGKLVNIEGYVQSGNVIESGVAIFELPSWAQVPTHRIKPCFLESGLAINLTIYNQVYFQFTIEANTTYLFSFSYSVE